MNFNKIYENLREADLSNYYETRENLYRREGELNAL